MPEFVNSGLCFVQDENNFINPLLQVGSGSVEKSTEYGSGGQKINESGSSSLLFVVRVRGDAGDIGGAASAAPRHYGHSHSITSGNQSINLASNYEIKNLFV